MLDLGNSLLFTVGTMLIICKLQVKKTTQSNYVISKSEVSEPTFSVGERRGMR